MTTLGAELSLTNPSKPVQDLGTTSFYPKRSKSQIDEIDKLLAKHFCLSAAEMDFVLNYDIKFRLGQEDDEISDE